MLTAPKHHNTLRSFCSASVVDNVWLKSAGASMHGMRLHCMF